MKILVFLILYVTVFVEIFTVYLICVNLIFSLDLKNLNIFYLKKNLS